MVRGFEDFFRIRVANYVDFKRYELGFVGSIAYYYKPLLEEVADKYGMKINLVTKCPIDKLVDYHIENPSVKIENS